MDRKKREALPHEKIKKDDFAKFKNNKILIAEDNIINQKVIRAILADSGISMLIVDNGKETLDVLEINPDIDMVFMDIHMPILDGLQATKIIRENSRYDLLPIVAFSGDTAADDVKKMFDVGMDSYLEKPLRMDSLYDALYLYTSEKKETNLVKYEIIMQELDTKMALTFFDQNREFYIEILDEFVQKYIDSWSTLFGYLKENNKTKANIFLFDLASVSQNIGARNLHDICTTLMKNIQNPDDLEYINSYKEFKRSLSKTCEAIVSYKNSFY